MADQSTTAQDISFFFALEALTIQHSSDLIQILRKFRLGGQNSKANCGQFNKIWSPEFERLIQPA